MASYQAAKAYYQKYADKNSIRKIQQFLATRKQLGGGGKVSSKQT